MSKKFSDQTKRGHIRCEFDPENIVLVDTRTSRWTAVYAGALEVLDWGALELPPSITNVCMGYVRERLRTCAPTYLSYAHHALSDIAGCLQSYPRIQRFDDVSTAVFRALWIKLSTAETRSFLRQMYLDLTQSGEFGTSHTLAMEIQTWKSRTRPVSFLSDVMLWNPERGALTSAEVEILRNKLSTTPPQESPRDHATRIFGWILLETLKRSQQVLEMRRDALTVISSPKGVPQYLLRIPQVKAQRGRESALWRVTRELGEEILRFSSNPVVCALQRKVNRLIVMPSQKGGECKWESLGQVPVTIAGDALYTWAIKQDLVSPRTNAPLVVRPRRLRHTGATAMARQGVSREEIQYILEHDSPRSAQYYIDSVCADLLPMIERADRGLGEVFSEISDAFFKGKLVVDTPKKKLITIPVKVETPAIVGTCASSTTCTKHPFISCYDGCPYFLAWRDADHSAALEYVENESKRWRLAEGGTVRSKIATDFDRVAAGIREVMRQIAQALGAQSGS